jgi:hypothetical protein
MLCSFLGEFDGEEMQRQGRTWMRRTAKPDQNMQTMQAEGTEWRTG